jgi:Tfp pilus assembly protein PilX
MRANNRRNEKGVALLLSILALVLLTGVAVTMMYMSSTEAVISSNFKAEETEYFAARAGVEEIRDRMIPGVAPYSIFPLLPAVLPGAANAGVLYILQNGVTMANVTANTPATNPLFDDELCHDYSFGGTLQQQPANIRCNTLPGGVAWYNNPPGAAGLTTVPTGSAGGVAPAWAAANPLDWKWTRITLKGNNSSAYSVDSTQAAATTQVCWDGTKEILLAGALTCQTMSPFTYPVYLVTALGVNQNGARRLVQQELAQNPSGQPAGLFALGNGCGALAMGGGATTYSFNSSTEPGGPVDPPTNTVAAGGSVGANGNVSIGGGSVVNGNTYTDLSATVGNCNQGNGVTSNGGGSNPGNVKNIPGYPQGTPYIASVPPFPTNPVPPIGNVQFSNQQLPAGTYGDVIIKGTVTLPGGTAANPAVYTMDSLTVGPGDQLNVTGPVIININYHGNGNAVKISGFANSTYVASDFTVNYGGPGSVSIASANAGAYAVINAPNANVSLTGNANFYGQVLGSSINVTGSAKFYWDLGTNTTPNTSPYFEISLRELSY